MAWSISDLFPPWGDSGERPSDNFQYDGGDQVNEKHLDYLWSQVGALENEVRSALTDLDSDGDGVVDKADSGATGFTFDGGATLNGNLTLGNDLIATNGETIWDESNSYIPTVRLQADTDGDGLVEAFDESLLKDGGSRELDAAELGGSSGTSGQVLQTDGAAASWSSVAYTRTDVSEDGTTVVSETNDINFGDGVRATDDGDGTATVDTEPESIQGDSILFSQYAPYCG